MIHLLFAAKKVKTVYVSTYILLNNFSFDVMPVWNCNRSGNVAYERKRGNAGSTIFLILLGDEDDDDEEEEVEENISNLYEEAMMPLKEVIEKYTTKEVSSPFLKAPKELVGNSSSDGGSGGGGDADQSQSSEVPEVGQSMNQLEESPIKKSSEDGGGDATEAAKVENGEEAEIPKKEEDESHSPVGNGQFAK